MHREPISPAHERAADRPWIQGRSVAQLVSLLPPGRPQPLGIAVRIVMHACHGMEAMHELSGPDGCLLGDALIAPEVARGEDIDAAADVFSLGALLYWLTTGHAPTLSLPGFDPAAPVETNAWTLPPRAVFDRYPRALRDVVLCALALQREDRFQTATEMGLALAAAFPGHASEEELAEFLERFDLPDSVSPSHVPVEAGRATSPGARVAFGTLAVAFAVAFGVTVAISSGQVARTVSTAPPHAARPPVAAPPPVTAPPVAAPDSAVPSIPPPALPTFADTRPPRPLPAPSPPPRRARPAASARQEAGSPDAAAQRYGI